MRSALLTNPHPVGVLHENPTLRAAKCQEWRYRSRERTFKNAEKTTLILHTRAVKVRLNFATESCGHTICVSCRLSYDSQEIKATKAPFCSGVAGVVRIGSRPGLLCCYRL